MYKILIVEDDNYINEMLREVLGSEKIDVISAFSGTEGKLYIDLKLNELDLILLDLMLPGMSGESLLKYIRSISDIPVIVVSAKSIQEEKVQMLKEGADDYIVKPFDINELIVRVNNILKRNKFNAMPTKGNIDEYKNIKIEKDTFEVSVCDKKIDFTHREILLLEVFIENPKRIFTKANLYEKVWNEEYIGDDNTLNVHISNIRKKIVKNGGDDIIETVWGIGYKLK
ncbi:MAG: response regulator transcription factor [Sarcina sp.]